MWLMYSSPPHAELYFLIARFLEAGPCQNAAEVGYLTFKKYLLYSQDGMTYNLVFYSLFRR